MSSPAFNKLFEERVLEVIKCFKNGKKSKKNVCDNIRTKDLYLNWYDQTNSYFRKHGMPVHSKFFPTGTMMFDFTNKLGKNFESSLQIFKVKQSDDTINYHIEEYFYLNDKCIKHKSLQK